MVRLNPCKVRLNPHEVRLNPHKVRLNPHEVRLNPCKVRLSPRVVRFTRHLGDSSLLDIVIFGSKQQTKCITDGFAQWFTSSWCIVCFTVNSMANIRVFTFASISLTSCESEQLSTVNILTVDSRLFLRDSNFCFWTSKALDFVYLRPYRPLCHLIFTRVFHDKRFCQISKI